MDSGRDRGYDTRYQAPSAPGNPTRLIYSAARQQYCHRDQCHRQSHDIVLTSERSHDALNRENFKSCRIRLIQTGYSQRSRMRLTFAVRPALRPRNRRLPRRTPGGNALFVLLFKSPAPISAPRPLSLSTHCFPTRLQSFDLALT